MRKVFLALLFIVALSIFAGTTGKIVGRVYDASTKQGLPGVNVIIEGTTMGAATDLDGYFVILNVPPGTYDVTAQMIGYRKMTIQGVQVIADLTVTLEFPLQQTTVELKTGVKLTAKRKIIKKDVTTSVAIMDAEQMNAMPVNTVTGAVVQSAGVVAAGGLHVRGGRATEVVYVVDGIEMRDPYTGGYDSHIPQISVQETAVFTGGFGAEYGSAQSGVINIVTKEAPSRFTVNLTGRTNDAMGLTGLQKILDANEQWAYRWGNYIADTTGQIVDSTILDSVYEIRPEKYKRFDWFVGFPIIKKKLALAFSGEITKSDGHIINYEATDRKTFNGKLTIHPSPNIKLTLHGLYNVEYPRWYGASWKFNLDNLPKEKDWSYAFGINFSHALSSNTYWELKFNNYSTFMRYDVFEDGSFDLNGDDYINSTDTTQYYTVVDPYTGDTTIVEVPSDRDGIDDFTDQDNDRNVEIDTLGECGSDWPDLTDYPFTRVQDVNGYITGGYYRTAYHYDEKQIWTLKGDFVSQITREHQLKTGVEAKYYEIFNYTVDMASGGNVYMTYTSAYPSSYAAYIQDKMEFKDFIVNAGFRFDLFNPNSYMPADLYHPVTDVSRGGEILNPVKTTWKWKISPRIGFSFPITERDVLHFTYGHYFQIPPMHILYTNNTWDFSGAFPLIGNPDIDAEKTVSYEVGVKHAFNDYMKIDITAYMKDISGLTDTRQIFYTALNYYTLYTNADYGTSKGIEVAIQKFPGGDLLPFLTLNISYTFGIARGKASSYRQNYDFTWAGYVIPAEEHYLDWDQRHTLNMSIGFVTKNAGINFLTNYGSGLPWSPPSRGRVQLINTERLPYTLTTNVRAHYDFLIARKLKTSFVVDIYNLFNRKNILGIADAEWYNAYKDEDIYKAAMGAYKDPRNISRSRFVRLGLEIKL